MKAEIHFPRHWYQRAELTLLEPFISPTGNYRVPAGFTTDGTSAPILFRVFVPQLGPAAPASVVHDWLLQQDIEWVAAAMAFRAELKSLPNVSCAKERVLYWLVRAWGIRNAAVNRLARLIGQKA